MKPMSSIRSASSSTTASTPVEHGRCAGSMMVEQAAGGGDQDVDAAGQRSAPGGRMADAADRLTVEVDAAMLRP